MKNTKIETDKTRRAMNVGIITIEKDGWVWVSTRDRKHEIGLGDINVDVFIEDKRKTVKL
jgi:hypothetical protein